MSNITSIIQGCIEPAFELPREQECWVIKEDNPGAANKKLLVNGNGIYGFSLDCSSVPKPVWKFLKPSALSGMSSVCDGIFVTTYNSIDYFIVIDLKSTKASGATKQVVTGIHLCQWIYSVLNLHGHLQRSVKFIGVISKLSKRTQASKRTTARAPLPDPDIHYSYPIYRLNDYNRISLTEICKNIEARRIS
ncbi:hypothetical protein AB1287_05225 [Enterobacter asburiae]|uniref:hypothetical protein n=1 Tax=Scandinavium sp. UTDF21-P1B TaxID=3446379 RepID=UPI00347D91DE